MAEQDKQPDNLPRVGDVIMGKYRIQGVLGRGGMGAVYSALHTVTGKLVALKWLLPEHANEETRARLVREARSACSVQHPNVVDVYDVCEHEGGLFIVMQCLRGQTLGEIFEVQLQLDPEELLRVLIPAMRGVHAAHRAGVIHRDLKPENIILARVDDGGIEPKVVDFGISKKAEPGELVNKSLTSAGVIIGTPHYMSIEQIDGSRSADLRCDVYAFGVILYEGLTGRLPFDAEQLGDLAMRIATQQTPRLRQVRPDLPEALEAVVLKAMARDRGQRYPDVQTLALDLEPFAGGITFQRDSVRTATPSLANTGVDQTQIDTEKMRAEARSLASSIVPHTRRARMTAAAIAAALLVSFVGWWTSGETESAIDASAAPRPPQVPGPVDTAPAATTAEPEPEVEATGPALAMPPQAPAPLPEQAPRKRKRRQRKARVRPRPRRPQAEPAVKTEAEQPQAPARIRGHRTPGMSADEF